MTILWVCSSPIGPAAELLNIGYGGTSGGWIGAEFEKIKNDGDEFAFLTMRRSVKRGGILKKSGSKGNVYCIHSPVQTYGIDAPGWMKENIHEVYRMFSPDIIQIWGTESVLSVTACAVASEAKKIIFLQGIIGYYVRYKKRCVDDNAIRSLKYRAAESLKTRLYTKQAEMEKQALHMVNAVILDNDFSQAYCRSINSDLQMIRYPLLPKPCFFSGGRTKEKTEPFSIFTVAGATPMKGLHMLLRAVFLIKNRFPGVRVYIPGSFNQNAGGYERFLYRLISKYSLEKQVVFCGVLTAEEMADYMRRCEIFVNPSCMEVHALTLREAMAMGMPCVSTECGSVAEFIRHGENGLLYRYEEPKVCAYYIAEIFENRSLRENLSRKAALVWTQQHNHTLTGIYRALTEQKTRA